MPRRWVQWVLWMVFAAPAFGQAPPARSTGQTLYLPVYSHILHGEVGKRGELAKTLVSVMVSIRNTDTARSLRVTSAVYFDTDGKRVKEYVSTPRTVAPMGTHELFVPRSDGKGGSGANFVIVWKADSAVNPPLVEAVHADLPAGRSIAFITSARPIAPD